MTLIIAFIAALFGTDASSENAVMTDQAETQAVDFGGGATTTQRPVVKP